MNSHPTLIPVRCVGALIRKPRSWPPTVKPPQSAAAKLAANRKWEPTVWAAVHKRASEPS
jgi:Na+-transporting methylmalonyl-CoA/oxaloacetate decarboxylase gamma subunit